MKRGIPEDKEIELEIQIAPVVDLMLVLITAFTMTVGQKVVEAELGVEVPGQAQKAAANTDTITPLRIDIQKNGQVRLSNTDIDGLDDPNMPALKEKLTRAITSFGDKQSVIISPHADTPHQRVVDVINACSSAKVTKLSFAGGSLK